MIKKRWDKQKQTMLAFTMQGIFFFIGYCFFDVNTVIPVFIQTFTGKVELAGIASTIRQFSTLFVQILLGTYIVKVKKVPRYLGTCLMIGYAMPLLAVLPLAAGWPGNLLVITVFLAVAVMWTCDGLMVIGYYDLLGRIITPPNRARVLGYQQLFGGLGAMAGAMIVKKILDLKMIPITSKYIIIFSIGAGILLLGAVSMFFAEDVEYRHTADRYSLKEHLMKIPEYLRNSSSLRIIMYCQICFTIAAMVSPYVLIMCKEQFQMKDELISSMLNVQVLGTLLGGGISAFLAPRLGNRIIVSFYCFLSMLCGGCGLAAIHNIGSRNLNILIMVLTSGIASAAWAGFMNVMIDLSKGENTYIYMLINSVVTLPLSFAGVIAGQIIKYNSYQHLLFTSLIFAAGAFIISFGLYDFNIRRQG